MDPITFLDSGCVGDHIEWTVTASDGSDDSADTTEVFEVVVVNPGNGSLLTTFFIERW